MCLSWHKPANWFWSCYYFFFCVMVGNHERNGELIQFVDYACSGEIMVWVEGYIKFNWVNWFPWDFLILITLGHPYCRNCLHWIMNCDLWRWKLGMLIWTLKIRNLICKNKKWLVMAIISPDLVDQFSSSSWFHVWEYGLICDGFKWMSLCCSY